MKVPRHCAVTLTLALAATVSLAACSPSPPAARSTATGTETSTALASSTSARDPEPPNTPAPIADGTYRVRLTANDLTDGGGYDGGAAGTWTLTLKHGRYQLHCARVDKDSGQCGDSAEAGGDSGIVVEVGRAVGDKSTLWLIYDQASTLAVNGCTSCNPTNEQLAPYYLEWGLDGQDLVLQHLWAKTGFNKDMPEVNNFTLKPWKKIG